MTVPEHKVDRDNTLGLGVLVVVDNSGLSLHPHKATYLSQHAVLACAHLALRKHLRDEERRG